jgi:hypothetical protein
MTITIVATLVSAVGIRRELEGCERRFRERHVGWCIRERRDAQRGASSATATT